VDVKALAVFARVLVRTRGWVGAVDFGICLYLQSPECRVGPTPRCIETIGEGGRADCDLWCGRVLLERVVHRCTRGRVRNSGSV
jgi:hypothetical protein